MMSRVVRQSVRFFSNSTRVIKEELKLTPNTAFKIRPIRTDEIPQVVKLTREIIGSLFNVKNTESIYDGGVFSAHEKYRHLDVGRKLLKECFQHSQGKNFVGNTKVDVVRAYIGGGSNILESDWKSLEYETDTPVNPATLMDELPSGVEIVSFQNSLLAAIFEYDYALAGYERKFITEASCNEENSKSLVAMKDGKCVGFGSMKLIIVEYGRIGPLYADDPSVAEAMVKRLITAMPEAKGLAMCGNYQYKYICECDT
ncbi:n-acetyltransferase domain-containing protein [Trichonephila inaurata madagascariensis]|uniref:N-acetyltransferase domain-containing protein n=1 Tax=Trichonephila inaurata madagascariensis TaxID=2747483 RepID=A0A8X6WUA6_9ARAC|nr:n-acetyltransferase domain-containing protein [Trichonephila inaurata madagascariensis]